MRSGLRKKPKNGGAASGNPENSPDAAERYYCDAGLYEAPDGYQRVLLTDICKTG